MIIELDKESVKLSLHNERQESSSNILEMKMSRSRLKMKSSNMSATTSIWTNMFPLTLPWKKRSNIE